MSTWLDKLPSQEKARIRERLRSPAEYERLRESVKGPEDLKEELARNERLAELSFALETEPPLKEALKQQIEADIREKGMEAVLQKPMEGGFDLRVEENPQTNQDQLMLVPEGNVSEKIPVRSSFAEQYLTQFAAGMGNT